MHLHIMRTAALAFAALAALTALAIPGGADWLASHRWQCAGAVVISLMVAPLALASDAVIQAWRRALLFYFFALPGLACLAVALAGSIIVSATPLERLASIAGAAGGLSAVLVFGRWIDAKAWRDGQYETGLWYLCDEMLTAMESQFIITPDEYLALREHVERKSLAGLASQLNPLLDVRDAYYAAEFSNERTYPPAKQMLPDDWTEALRDAARRIHDAVPRARISIKRVERGGHEFRI
jgi:hypothetical protein